MLSVVHFWQLFQHLVLCQDQQRTESFTWHRVERRVANLIRRVEHHSSA